MTYKVANKPFAFFPKMHITESFKLRADWPFHIMPVNSSIEMGTERLYNRAVAASRHYERTRGHKYNHLTTSEGTFLIYRTK